MTLVLLGLNGFLWLLAKTQVSQSNVMLDGKSSGNNKCRYPTEGCPNHLCQSHASLLFVP
ncbi:hypothetical protein HanIR_Chr13g0669091 [Helianthus annuus]|nr:hypothetical protein HanIR_Chr13g0669091 [Helianthus annuus]